MLYLSSSVVSDLGSREAEIDRMNRSTAVKIMVMMMRMVTIQSISTGTDGLTLEPGYGSSQDDAFNQSISRPSSTGTTAAAAATTSSSSSSSSGFPVLPSPDYLFRLRRNNRTSLFYAYFHSVEAEEEGDGVGRNMDSNPLPLRRESGDVAHLTNKEYDDKGAMYFAIVVVLLYGISIALLIASTVRSSRTDDELKTFMRSFAEVNRATLREEKQKMHRLLQLHESHGPPSVLPEAQVDSSAILLRPCKSSEEDDLGLDGEEHRKRCDEDQTVMVTSRCSSTQSSYDTASLYDSVPFIDE